LTTDSTPSHKAILKKYESCSEEVKKYFMHLLSLVKNHPYEVSLAYLFLHTEKAHNRILYCGVVKLHRAESNIADIIINKQHLTRSGFLDLYNNVFGKSLDTSTLSKIKEAEKIRDKVIHGKSVKDADIRQAIIDVLDYAEALNAELFELAGFKPFGDLRGFKGRGQSLDKNTTRWLMKGIGFTVA